MIFKNKQSGFTLIELLVAMTILALVSFIGLTTYTHSQVGARDARRKQDLLAIATALELFYEKNGYYPLEDGSGGTHAAASNDNPGGPWIPGLGIEYINIMPRDPLRDSGHIENGSGTGYMYESYNRCKDPGPQPANTHWFKLETVMENPLDPQINGDIASQDCDPVDDGDYNPSVGCGTSPNLFCIYSYGTPHH